MSSHTQEALAPVVERDAAIPIVQVIRGRVETGGERLYRSRDLGAPLAAPAADLNAWVFPRSEPQPAMNLPIGEVMDFLGELGARLDLDRNDHLRRAFELAGRVNVLGAKALEQGYRSLGVFFRRDYLDAEYAQALGSMDDGWREVERPDGSLMRVRPFPARILHVLAGNAPGMAATAIVRGSLSRGVHLLKLPSNDLFTAPAILATMAEIDANHPLVQSFSAAYWRGGEQQIESALFRPQFFDKVMAWGGGDAIANVQKYMSPGLELVSLDPKTSISIICREAFANDRTLMQAAAAAGVDVGSQEACGSSRVQFIEGSVEEADRYCAELLDQLRFQAETAGGGRVTPSDLREEVNALRLMDPEYRVWGEPDGRGLVVRSEEPVQFDLISRTVNVVPVANAIEAAKYVNVATQTVGVYPAQRKVGLRDALCAGGAQRVTTLGAGGARPSFGRPHDGFYPLNRMVRWVADED